MSLAPFETNPTHIPSLTSQKAGGSLFGVFLMIHNTVSICLVIPLNLTLNKTNSGLNVHKDFVILL